MYMSDINEYAMDLWDESGAHREASRTDRLSAASDLNASHLLLHSLIKSSCSMAYNHNQGRHGWP